ncbi:MAG: glycosyltransferase family 4 protein [Janthinobacterium lividum]
MASSSLSASMPTSSLPQDRDRPTRTRPDQPALIDVSRLIWRWWRGRLPTGIDRVCLAYVDRFGTRANAVIQWRGRRVVLAPGDSRRLMMLLQEGGPRFRQRFVALLSRAFPRALTRPRHGALYLNIGHTGLDDPTLGVWIARHGLRAVYLVHDLIPIDAPEFCRAGEADKHLRRVTNALTSASGIIANSRVTVEGLRDFAERQHLCCPPMIAAWLAGDTLPAIIAPAPTELPYFVSVGTIEGRKNHILLLRLWKRLVERMGRDAPRLVLVGQRGWEADHALAMLDRCAAIKGVVVELGRCGDAELAGLLAHARALLMPSFAEGFGMPVIEALQLGTPVIASDLPVFREIAGDIPTYLPSFDGIGWERTILDFCGASAERMRQVEAMRAYRAPDWSSHFALVEPWLASLPQGRAAS